MLSVFLMNEDVYILWGQIKNSTRQSVREKVNAMFNVRAKFHPDLIETAER